MRNLRCGCWVQSSLQHDAFLCRSHSRRNLETEHRARFVLLRCQGTVSSKQKLCPSPYRRWCNQKQRMQLSARAAIRIIWGQRTACQAPNPIENVHFSFHIQARRGMLRLTCTCSNLRRNQLRFEFPGRDPDSGSGTLTSLSGLRSMKTVWQGFPLRCWFWEGLSLHKRPSFRKIGTGS